MSVFPLPNLNNPSNTKPGRTSDMKIDWMNWDPLKELAIKTEGDDGFEVCIDVQQFHPNEISVKVVDNSIIVEGKHGERVEDHNDHVSRQFVRKYKIPSGFDTNQLMSTLSSDGVLSVKAPPLKGEPLKGERVVRILTTGPARLNIKKSIERSA